MLMMWGGWGPERERNLTLLTGETDKLRWAGAGPLVYKVVTGAAVLAGVTLTLVYV